MGKRGVSGEGRGEWGRGEWEREGVSGKGKGERRKEWEGQG